MNDLLLLSASQMRRIEPFFPLSYGVPRLDDRRVLSGILFAIRNGLRWRDAPAAYGPHKTIYNRLSAGADWACSTASSYNMSKRSGDIDKLMIDATHLKAHRTAASLLKQSPLSQPLSSGSISPDPSHRSSKLPFASVVIYELNGTLRLLLNHH